MSDYIYKNQYIIKMQRPSQAAAQNRINEIL